MVGHPSALRLILVDSCSVYRSHATLSLTSAEPNPLCPEGLTCAKANLTIADRGTGAEAHPMVAVSSGAIGQPPHVPARIGVRHPRDRPARSDIRHARRHGLRVSHSGWGLAVAYARDVGREGVRWRDRRVTRWAVVEAHPSDPEGGAHKPACNRSDCAQRARDGSCR
jgi:hypothetical protein